MKFVLEFVSPCLYIAVFALSKTHTPKTFVHKMLISSHLRNASNTGVYISRRRIPAALTIRWRNSPYAFPPPLFAGARAELGYGKLRMAR